MHPVLAKLSPARRRELFANPLLTERPEDLRAQLFDAVLKVRAGLDLQDTLADDSDYHDFKTVAAKLKVALTSQRAPVYDDDGETSFYVDEETSRRLLVAVEDVRALWKMLRSRKRLEAIQVRRALSNLGIKVTLTTPTPVKPNHGLDLIGLLADPPNTGEAILKHLQRGRLRR